MTQSRRPRLLAVLAAALLAAFPARSQDEIRLGAVLPVTGKESKIGGAYKQATEFAVKEVNDAGGLDVGGKKMKVDLRLLDDTSEASKSAQLVEQLMAQQKVHAVVGGYGSQLVQAQSVVPDRYGIPFVAGGAGATSIYGRSKWVFGDALPRREPRDDADGVPLGPRQGGEAQAAAEDRDRLREHRAREGLPEGHPGLRRRRTRRTSRSRSTRASRCTRPTSSRSSTRVQDAKADLFMCDAHLEDYISMQRTYTQMGLYHLMVTYGARGSDEAARKGLGAATDYIFASGWWSDLLPYPQVKALTEKYKAATGTTPQWYHACAYETVRAIFTAIKKAGSLKPEAIRAALAGLEMKDSILPGGVLKFSKTGQAVLPFVVTQNKANGKLDLVWPKDARTGPPVAPIPKS